MNENQEVSIKFINTITGDQKLQEYEKRLENIYAYISSINAGQKTAIKDVKTAVNGLGKETDETKNKTVELSKTLKSAFDVAGIIGAITVMKKLINVFGNLSKKSSDYIENLNLLEVAYANIDKATGKFNESIEESSERIETFISKMADVYGFDESNLTRQFGIFKQLANAMQLPTETAENLSELMVKMSNDIASLYNLDLSRASNALQSALAGQVRPIRTATGADITEKTLQSTVDTLGLDKSISQLSYVEKRLIMVISLTDQLKKSQGDWGRTIESVANQTRIMKEQWSRLGRAIGNVFYPIIEKVLPYLNAMLMVLTEIFNLVASLMGFEMPEFDYSGLAGVSDETQDIIDGMNDAGDSVDELNKKLKGLRGFDKLNVINTPTDNSKTSGSGIDPAIMEAFTSAFGNYNDMMDEVNMKARQLRDSILDWLGFTDGTYKNLKLIAGVLGTIVGLKIISGISKLINILGSSSLVKGFKNVAKYIANSASGMKMLAKGTISLKTFMQGIVSPVMQIVGGISLIVVGVIRTADAVKGFIDGTMPILEGVLKIIEGIALVVAGVAVLLGGWTVAIVAGAVALTAFITEWIVENWEAIKQFFANIWDGFYETVITPIVNWIKPIATWIWDNAIKPIIDFFKPIVDAVIEIFTLIVTKVAEIVAGIGEAIWSIIKKVTEIFLKIVEIFVELGKALYKYVISPVIEWVGKAFKWFYDTLIKPIINLFVDVGKWVYDHIVKPIWDKICWLKDKAVEIFKSIGTTVVEFVSGTLKSVINGVLSGFEGLINTFISMLNGAIWAINLIPGVDIQPLEKLNIPRLKTGLDFVPSDYYPAYLDYGERVLTKEENRDYTAQMQGIGKNNNQTPINPTFIIQVGDEKIANVVINNLQDMAKTNGKPIVIGG